MEQTRLDIQTKQHFSRWLETVAAADRREVRRAIVALVARDPDVLQSHSWPEMRRMTDGYPIY